MVSLSLTLTRILMGTNSAHCAIVMRKQTLNTNVNFQLILLV